MYSTHKYDEDWGSLFIYDETSPSCLRWKVDRYRGPKLSQRFIQAGDVVGSLNAIDGYWHVHVFGKVYNAQNIIWTMFHGHQGQLHVDHIDKNRGNNKISNLRILTHTKNMQNKSKYSSNKSGVTGVVQRDVKSRHGDGKFNSYWVAQWSDGKPKSKAFSISKLGEEEAYKRAVEYRNYMVEKLNKEGAGYTEDHGK